MLQSRHSILVACALSLGCVGFSSVAGATVEFAQVMAGEPYNRTDGCLLCHLDLIGAAGTAVQPFALSLKDAGLKSTSDGAELRQILEHLDTDSDGDGVDDVTELTSGTDPNHAEGGETSVVEYRYGCFRVAPGPSRGYLVFGLVTLIWIARYRQRRAGRWM